jgi:hypothetical protein
VDVAAARQKRGEVRGVEGSVGTSRPSVGRWA